MDKEKFKEILEGLIDELPPIFFQELSGGIVLEDFCKVSPYAQSDDMFILGEYVVNGSVGRQVRIYYGSFERMYSNLTEEALEEKLRGVLRHEFRHHLENRAGERGLEIEDANYIASYLKRKNVLE